MGPSRSTTVMSQQSRSSFAADEIVVLGIEDKQTIVTTSRHVIFTTGVPSSGKTTLAEELERRTSSFDGLSGDQAIREMNAETKDTAHGLFIRLLDLIEARMDSTNLIVDMSMPATYSAETQRRFGRTGLFVALRLDERDRVARDTARLDRAPVEWSPMLTELLGPDELYDLVIDTSEKTSSECAEVVLVKAAEYWNDPLL